MTHIQDYVKDGPTKLFGPIKKIDQYVVGNALHTAADMYQECARTAEAAGQKALADQFLKQYVQALDIERVLNEGDGPLLFVVGEAEEG